MNVVQNQQTPVCAYTYFTISIAVFNIYYKISCSEDCLKIYTT